MTKIAQIIESIHCFLGSLRFCYVPMQNNWDSQLPPEDLQEVALQTATNHSFQVTASYVKRCTSSETKRIFWPKKILLIAAEATIKSMARNQMRVVFISKTWILISSLWDHCHHLWYKSITHSNTCSFPKASTMINFENAFSYREILWMDDTFPNEIEKILWETDDEMTLRTQLARLW